jgi:hypothetical protein
VTAELIYDARVMIADFIKAVDVICTVIRLSTASILCPSELKV